jgi:uncharacterized membrane protein
LMSEERRAREKREEGPHARGALPRWPAAVALLAAGAIHALVSDDLTLGPRILLLSIVAVLLIPLIFAHLRGHARLTRSLALGLVALVTTAVAASVFLLISTLPGSGSPSTVLLRDAALIWVVNVLTFAVWYWEIDGGGPAWRRRDSHVSEDFLFPQMSRDERASPNWSPGFLDYLFLAFNTSTAFSPTDTAVLSRRAKVLTMIQSLLSLMAIAVLAARAINTL